ncbi:MAG: hypothetical protein WBP52_06430 [Terriglobales bacterium]
MKQMDPKLESAINLAEYRIEMGKVRYISPAEWRKIMDEVPAIRSRAELQAILEKVSHWNENESREKLEKQKLLRRAAALGTLGQHPRAQQDRQRMIELTENPCRQKQAAALGKPLG